jgi:hypothetical protein
MVAGLVGALLMGSGTQAQFIAEAFTDAPNAAALNKPAGMIAGDLMVLIATNGSAPTPPTGFTTNYSGSDGSITYPILVASKAYDGSENPSMSATTGSVHLIAVRYSVGVASVGTPAFASGGSCTLVTPSGDIGNRLVLSIMFDRAIGTLTQSTPAGFTSNVTRTGTFFSSRSAYRASIVGANVVWTTQNSGNDVEGLTLIVSGT